MTDNNDEFENAREDPEVNAIRFDDIIARREIMTVIGEDEPFSDLLVILAKHHGEHIGLLAINFSDVPQIIEKLKKAYDEEKERERR